MDEKIKRNQIIIRICCIIAAFGLWLYINGIENPIRENIISVPVEIVNKDTLTDSKLALIDDQSSNINLTISGATSDVYSVKPSSFKLRVDLSGYAIKKGENTIPVQLVQQPDNIKIVNTERLWIKINVDEYAKKKVPVKINVEGKTKTGFYQLQPKLNLSQIEISGPLKYVSQVTSLLGKLQVDNLSKDFTSNVILNAVDNSDKKVEFVNFQPSIVEVMVPIKKVKTVGINVKTKGNLNNGLVLKGFDTTPDKIDIAGDDKVLDSIQSIDTEPVDLSKVNGSDDTDVKLVIPQGVSLVNNNGYIKVKVTSEKISQKTLSVNVITKNLKDGYDAVLNTKQVSVTVMAADSIINNLNSTDITAAVDLNNLGEGDHNIAVDITLPQGFTKASVVPASLQVSIKKKILEGKNGN
ncbi:MAG: YbbR family protein [Clostridiaceae bacterium]|nr:YbbR family protein [Clostridiaceae bacterium]